MKKLLQYLAMTAATIGFTVSAQALPSLFYWNPNTSHWDLLAVDQGAGDSSSIVGKVSFDGGTTTAPGFQFDLTGTTIPLKGNTMFPFLDLHYYVMSTGPGVATLTVGFGVDNMGPTVGGTSASIGGTSDPATSTLVYQTFSDNSNALMGQANPLTSITINNVSPYSQSANGNSINAPFPYSIAQILTFTTTGSGVLLTGDASFTVPDAGTTVMLLGFGLTAIGLFGRFRKRLA